MGSGRNHKPHDKCSNSCARKSGMCHLTQKENKQDKKKFFFKKGYQR